MGYFYIYSLTKNGDIFYVGITDSLNRRLREHTQNLGPGIEIHKLEEFVGDPKGAINIETNWINKFKAEGIVLSNVGTPRKYTENAGKPLNGGCLNCGNSLIYVHGKKAKTFCNSTCRSNYWQKNKRKEKRPLEVPKITREIVMEIRNFSSYKLAIKDAGSVVEIEKLVAESSYNSSLAGWEKRIISDLGVARSREVDF